MKRFLRSIAARLLAVFARAAIRRYRPKIIMVTGSVGKTSTKDAIAAALMERFFVRKSEKSFNSEFGVPFTILGVRNPWGNPAAWFGIMKSALALLVLPNHYPKLLVLEVGADKPGDLAGILKIAMPDAVVLTRFPEVPVHVEAYPSPEAVREEEFSPAYALPPGAPLILSSDDPYARDMAKRVAARSITYGLAESDLQVDDVDYCEEDGRVVGMQASIAAQGDSGKIVVRGSVGKTQILPAAAAAAAAISFGMTLTEALAALSAYEPPAGRGRLFLGTRGTTLIDDSYNSSPAAVEEALVTLKNFPGAKRRVAVLGDMLELGRYSVAEHERIGALAGAFADIVVAVGVRAAAFARTADGAKAYAFDDSSVAARELPSLLEEGDVVLIKGSQSIRTERITEALLADGRDAARLVRQERAWKRRA
jgi:UDP-N-acetylmuramoyl-tripeptide--D-alanyl-D-alanine ligase